MNLLEYIRVGAGPQWTDWHETIATPNFVWSTDADDAYYTINGGAPQFTGITFAANDTIVNFVFPTTEPVGTVILLHKELQYMGDITFDKDEYIRADTDAEKLAKLGPAFIRDGGTVTAGSAILMLVVLAAVRTLRPGYTKAIDTPHARVAV